MKAIVRAALLVISAMLIPALAKAQTAPPPFAPPPMAPAKPISAWKTFKSEQGKFSVLLPTKPEEDHQSKDGVKAHLFNSFLGQFIFKLNYVEFPSGAADPKSLLDRTLAEISTRKELKLVADKVVEVDGYAGREIALETEIAFVQMRFFIVENRIYQLNVSSLNQKAETQEARAFLDSFRFLKSGAAKQPAQNNSKPQ